jgi:hypothetical protein
MTAMGREELSEMMSINSAFYIYGFHTRGFNQLRVGNIQEKMY